MTPFQVYLHEKQDPVLFSDMDYTVTCYSTRRCRMDCLMSRKVVRIGFMVS